MSAIPLNLPADVVVKGELQPDFDPTDRDEDALEIDLPNGLTIDVGWYPELKGFQIVVFRDYWDNQDKKPIVTADVYEVAQIIRQLVADYTAPARTVGVSEAKSIGMNGSEPTASITSSPHPVTSSSPSVSPGLTDPCASLPTGPAGSGR